MTLPFLDSENDMYINLCIVLIIISVLSKTNRGTLKLNNGRLHSFLYLLKNPTALNKVFGALGKGNVLLADRDTFSITSISPNIDALFDRVALKSLLSFLVAKGLVVVIYKKGDGFFYAPSESGLVAVSQLKGEYLLDIRALCEKLKSLLSTSESQLNNSINQIFKAGSV